MHVLGHFFLLEISTKTHRTAQRLYEDMMFLNLFYRNMGSFCWSESENWQFMGAAGLVHHHQLSSSSCSSCCCSLVATHSCTPCKVIQGCTFRRGEGCTRGRAGCARSASVDSGTKLVHELPASFYSLPPIAPQSSLWVIFTAKPFNS